MQYEYLSFLFLKNCVTKKQYDVKRHALLIRVTAFLFSSHTD